MRQQIEMDTSLGRGHKSAKVRHLWIENIHVAALNMRVGYVSLGYIGGVYGVVNLKGETIASNTRSLARSLPRIWMKRRSLALRPRPQIPEYVQER